VSEFVLNNLDSRQRLSSYVALYASIITWGMSFAGLVPLMALVMEGRGTNPVLIGLVAAANPIGVIVAAPFVIIFGFSSSRISFSGNTFNVITRGCDK